MSRYEHGRLGEAVAGYDKALRLLVSEQADARDDEEAGLLRMTRASWLNNRGFVLGSLASEAGADATLSRQHEQDAIASFRAAVALEAESGRPSDGRAAANLAKFEARAAAKGKSEAPRVAAVDPNDLVNLAQQRKPS